MAVSHPRVEPTRGPCEASTPAPVSTLVTAWRSHARPGPTRVHNRGAMNHVSLASLGAPRVKGSSPCLIDCRASDLLDLPRFRGEARAWAEGTDDMLSSCLLAWLLDGHRHHGSFHLRRGAVLQVGLRTGDLRQRQSPPFSYRSRKR